MGCKQSTANSEPIFTNSNTGLTKPIRSTWHTYNKSQELVKAPDTEISTKDDYENPQDSNDESEPCQFYQKKTSRFLFRSGSKQNINGASGETWGAKILQKLNQTRLNSSSIFSISGSSSLEGFGNVGSFIRPKAQGGRLFNPTVDINTIFEFHEVLGRGFFGEVRRAVHRSTGQVYAIKIIDKQSEAALEMNNPVNFRKILKQEVSNLTKFVHPNIISFTEAHESQNFIYLVMEYCDSGDLYQYLINCVREAQYRRKQLRRVLDRRKSHTIKHQESEKSITEIISSFPGPLSELEVTQLLSTMLKPIAYLHSRKYVHRDIKALNFLFTEADDFTTGIYLNQKYFGRPGKSQAKITEESESAHRKVRVVLTDFGMATRVDDNYPLRKKCGTPTFVAPEIICQAYGIEVDMWAFGVLAYLFIYGYYPFGGSNKASIMRKIKNTKPRFSRTRFGPSDLAIDFLQKCLEYNPKQRMTAMEALQHPWMKAGEAQKQYRYPLVTLSH